MGICRYCGQNAGLLRKQHGQCSNLHTFGIQEMVGVATQAATTHTLNEATLRQSLAAIANRSHAPDEDIERALEEGWK